MKQAKISLTADTRGFKKQIDDAKGMLKTLGDGNVSTAAADKLKKIYGVQLGASLKQLDKEIKNTKKTLETMASANSKNFDASKITTYTTKLETLTKRAKEYRAVQAQISSGESGDGGSVAGGGKFGKAAKMFAGVAGGMGIMASMSKRNTMADQRLRVKGLSTDGESVSEKSALGFSPEERRSRAAELARATPSTGAELSNLTNTGEQMERAYGISGDTFADSIGTARKAGMGDQNQFVKSVTGAARGAGLEGPQVAEYLQAITGYMGEMSKGVNIDGDSLNGFASAMSTLPFFKKDSQRTTEMMKGIEGGFKGGDEFQKAQTLRILDSIAPGASASALNMRMEAGVFGGLDNEKDPTKNRDQSTIDGLRKRGMSEADIKAQQITGEEYLEGLFKEISGATSGRSVSDQIQALADRANITTRSAQEIYANSEKDGKFDFKQMAEEVKAAQKGLTLKDDVNKKYNGADAVTKDVNALKEQTLEGIATKIADPINRLTSSIDRLIQAMGGDTEGIASSVGSAAVGVGAAVGGYTAAKTAGSLMKGGGKAVKATAKKAAKGGGKALTKAVTKATSKGTSKLLGKLIPGVGLVMAGIDAWDVYQKYQNGEEITAKDWAILATSTAAGVAGLIPGVGTGVSAALGAASVGAEFLPDGGSDGGGGGAGGTSPASEVGGGGSSGSTPAVRGSGGASGGWGGAGGESDSVLIENTLALKDLTQSLRTGGGGVGRSPIPDGAQVLSQGRHRG